MQLPNFLQRPPLPTVEKVIEVWHIVHPPVTTTVTVGVVATAIDHTPQSLIATAATACSPQPSAGPWDYASSQVFTSFDSVSLVSSFGEWLNQPLDVTPFDMLIWFSVVLGFYSLLTTCMAYPRFPEWARAIVEDTVKSFAAFSLFSWSVFFFIIHSLVYGYGDFNPTDTLAEIFEILQNACPCLVFKLFWLTSCWWKAHSGKRQTLWIVFQNESGYNSKDFKKIPGKGCTAIVVYTAKLARNIYLSLPLITTRSLSLLKWLVKLTWSLLKFLWTLIYCTYHKLYPHRLIDIVISFQSLKSLEKSHCQWPSSVPGCGNLRDYASHMSVQRRVDLLTELNQWKIYEQEFVKPLGMKAQDYLYTIHHLIKEINWYREVLDEWAGVIWCLANPRRTPVDCPRYHSEKYFVVQEPCPDTGFYYTCYMPDRTGVSLTENRNQDRLKRPRPLENSRVNLPDLFEPGSVIPPGLATRPPAPGLLFPAFYAECSEKDVQRQTYGRVAEQIEDVAAVGEGFERQEEWQSEDVKLLNRLRGFTPRGYGELVGIEGSETTETSETTGTTEDDDGEFVGDEEAT